jgi:MOSC domain-containing protein YiiM
VLHRSEDIVTLPATVRSINVGRAATLATPRGPVQSAIEKQPVHGSVRFEGINAAGDEQANRAVHGGPNAAIYAYAAEDYAWWETELGRALAPGTFGENLTTSGLDVNGAVIGERWRVGEAELQVAMPRVPCSKLAARMGDPRFVKTFARARRPGAYLRITRPGDVTAGDPITIVVRPSHGVRIVDVFTIYHFERERASELLAASELPLAWAGWAREQLVSG